MVEPRTAEDQLLQPVDERLATDERHAFPVTYEVTAETAARLVDPVALDELDEVGGLVVVELVVADETELDRRGGDAFFEVGAVEAEAVAEELDDVVVPGDVVGFDHD